MRSYVQSIKISVRNLLLQFIFSRIQLGLTPKTSGRGRGTNVVEYRLVAVKRLASPIGADQIEHPMFNRVPFRSAGGIMGDRDNQSKFIRQLLETHFPHPATATIGITTIGLDQQMFLVWIGRLPHRHPPATNCCHRKLWGVVRNADRDKALILSDIVNAVGYGFSLGQTWKVIHDSPEKRGAFAPHASVVE
jgi:hypothetical protein